MPCFAMMRRWRQHPPSPKMTISNVAFVVVVVVVVVAQKATGRKRWIFSTTGANDAAASDGRRVVVVQVLLQRKQRQLLLLPHSYAPWLIGMFHLLFLLPLLFPKEDGDSNTNNNWYEAISGYDRNWIYVISNGPKWHSFFPTMTMKTLTPTAAIYDDDDNVGSGHHDAAGNEDL